MQVKFEFLNPKSVKDRIRSRVTGAFKAGLIGFTEFIVEKLHHDEPQKYVSRAQAGYKTTPAQIAFFFATGILEKDGNGGIRLNHYKRTGETAAAFKMTTENNGYAIGISNEKPGAYWTRDDLGQTVQHGMAGRRKIGKVVSDNIAGALKAATIAMAKWIK